MVNELRKLHKICAFLALSPFLYRSKQLEYGQKLHATLLIAINLILAIYALEFKTFKDIIFVSNLVSKLLYINQCLSLIVTLIEVGMNEGKHFRFLEKSRRIKILLRRELAAGIDWRHVNRKQLRKIILYIVIVYGGLIVGIFIIFCENYAGYFGHALLAVFILRVRCLQLILYVDYIVIYLAALNIRLKSLVSCKVRQERKLLDMDYKRLESLEFLRRAKNVYSEILEFSKLFNESCGWSILTLSIVIFLDFMINVYWTILTWEKFYSNNYVFFTTSSVLALLVIISMFGYSCELTKRESFKIGQYLRKLLVAPQSNNLTGRIYNNLTKEFLLQVMEHPIEIDIKGYFTVDMQLLMGAMAAILTYLIILMQFRRTTFETDRQ